MMVENAARLRPEHSGGSLRTPLRQQTFPSPQKAGQSPAFSPHRYQQSASASAAGASVLPCDATVSGAAVDKAGTTGMIGAIVKGAALLAVAGVAVLPAGAMVVRAAVDAAAIVTGAEAPMVPAMVLVAGATVEARAIVCSGGSVAGATVVSAVGAAVLPTGATEAKAAGEAGATVSIMPGAAVVSVAPGTAVEGIPAFTGGSAVFRARLAMSLEAGAAVPGTNALCAGTVVAAVIADTSGESAAATEAPAGPTVVCVFSDASVPPANVWEEAGTSTHSWFEVVV
mmetsp:Transcript_100466/g.292851  ORF Transcript_100466/g.292851 Transcript_100466/m.292851 type:complete len:285 (+) Transcript_100466:858-1712(+)